MRGILNIRMLSVRAALLAVLAAGLVLPGAQAQSAKQNQKSDKQASGSSQAQASSAGSKAAEEESTPANKEHAGGTQEGIKIHGHWVIDVRNPDGTLVTHREFENAYVPSSILKEFLARTLSVGFWNVDLGGALRTYQLAEPLACPVGCDSSNLTFAPTVGFGLTGSFTAGVTDTIQSVATVVYLCPSSNPPATPCSEGQNFGNFTATQLSSPVSFISGQVVQVTVTITFS